jgi:hypothetical protein
MDEVRRWLLLFLIAIMLIGCGTGNEGGQGSFKQHGYEQGPCIYAHTHSPYRLCEEN